MSLYGSQAVSDTQRQQCSQACNTCLHFFCIRFFGESNKFNKMFWVIVVWTLIYTFDTKRSKTNLWYEPSIVHFDFTFLQGGEIWVFFVLFCQMSENTLEISAEVSTIQPVGWNHPAKHLAQKAVSLAPAWGLELFTATLTCFQVGAGVIQSNIWDSGFDTRSKHPYGKD